ncbi:MAG: hypothetical protein OEY52_10685 [Gammaproteobacteria bacterium]|nr:hypothetical protein [Gammaproteobacteria bacterium]
MSLDLTNELTQLLQNPHGAVIGSYQGKSFSLRFSIPDYAGHITNYYQDILSTDLQSLSQKVEIPFNFKHFGLICEFSESIELNLHDADMNLNPSIKQLVDRAGPVMIQNAYLASHMRDMGHRNRFPHLSFHVDRSPNQPTPYSMFTRNPFDDEQKEPRTASTVFVANIVAYLQLVKEQQCDPATEKGVRTLYNIFGSTDMTQVLHKIVLEQAWNQPRGIGEICIQDNRTVQHASYYRDAARNGYRIGVRYVG